MDSRAEFESWAKRAKNSPNDFIDEFFDRYSLPEDHYKLPWVSVSWEGWKASRQALEGEPVLWWDENDVWDLDECVKKTPTSRHTIPLYTHPASADVSDWEIEAKRAFWTGLEIGASMGAVSIAPRWNEYIAKRKEEMGQGVTGGGV